MHRAELSAIAFVLAAASLLAHVPVFARNVEYSGVLSQDGAPAEGRYRLRVVPYGSATGGDALGGAIVVPDVEVRAGRFSTSVELAEAIAGLPEVWLSVEVAGSDGVFEALPDRERLAALATGVCWDTGGNALGGGEFLGSTNDLPLQLRQNNLLALSVRTGTRAPFSEANFEFGASASTSNASGTLVAGTQNSAENTVYGNIGGGTLNRITGGDYGTVSGGYNNVVSNSATSIGGGENNTASGNTSTIAGGGSNVASSPGSAVGGGVVNQASGLAAFIGGGSENTASGGFSAVLAGEKNLASGAHASVGGGQENTATLKWSHVGGGYSNEATGDGSTIAGGEGNSASGTAGAVGGGAGNESFAFASTIAGGYLNTALGTYSTVGGGVGNTAWGDTSTVGGGSANCAGATYSWAGGSYAKVRPRNIGPLPTGACEGTPNSGDSSGDFGTFAWADASSTNPFVSSGANQFLVRAAGGIFLGGANSAVSIPAGRFLNTSTGAYLTTGGTWTNASSRALKRDFEAVDVATALDRVLELPLNRWRYAASPEEGQHLGPVAEDFHAAFGLGRDGGSISTVDASGVALAAIQGLEARRRAQHEQLMAENAALRERLEALERRLQSALERAR